MQTRDGYIILKLGGLYYDADGNPGAGTIAVAQLLDIAGDPVSTIAAADIVII